MIVSITLILLGILSIIYGVSIAAIKSGSNFYVIWIVIGFVMFLLAAAYKLKVWQKLSKTIKIVIVSLVGIGLTVFIAVEAMILAQFYKPVEQNLDYIIVLGAQVREDGPSLILRRRLEKAVIYLKDNPDCICIVSGGQGANEPFSEAEGMEKYLLEAGVDQTRIIKEDKSSNTLENIIFSKKLLNPVDAKVGILTNSFHVFRGVGIAKKQGLNASGIPAKSYAFNLPNNLLREFFGVLKDFIKGNM